MISFGQRVTTCTNLLLWTEAVRNFTKAIAKRVCEAIFYSGLLAFSVGIAQAQTVTEFSSGITAGAAIQSITVGPDGNLWFAENSGNRIGRITLGGAITEFSIGISASAGLVDITTGPDGNLWFTEQAGNRVGKITTAGVVTEYSAGISAGSSPSYIVNGSDGNLWFTEQNGHRIGRITPAGVVTEFSAGISSGAGPVGIAAGSDGNIWFTERPGNRIGRITTAGVITEFSSGISSDTDVVRIAAGPDGNLWFTGLLSGRVGRITPTGVVTEFSAGMAVGARPYQLAAGPDGNIWFTENSTGGKVGRVTTTGVVTEFGTGISAGAALTGIVSGPDGNIWFAERLGDRIGRITTGVVANLDATVNGKGTVTSSIPGISCHGVCSASFSIGATVTLTATPDAGSTFKGWSGACTGSTNTCTVSLSAARSVMATFNTLPIAASRFKDNGDGTVTDASTGLTWMRCAMGQAWAGATCVGTTSTYTWDQANALTGKQTFAGQSDWRLPNIRELQTIADRSKYFPAIDSIAFPTTSDSVFWSGSPNAADSNNAWLVYFINGEASFVNRSYGYSVRLVRGGQSFSALLNIARPSSSYIDQGDGTVTHSPTSLMWKRCAEGQLWSGSSCTGTASSITADQAAALSASYAGHTDWRVPTEEELMSLVDYSAFGPAVNAMIFPATPSSYFWSGSPDASDSNYAWFVYFDDGSAYSYGRGGGYAVRLVRGGQPPATLMLNVLKNGAGSVSSTPAGIGCGSTFTGWSGACTGSGSCIVSMSAAKNATASFKTIPFTVATTGVTAGVITAPVASVTNKISFNSADVGKAGAVFVTAVVPNSFLTSIPSSQNSAKAMVAGPMAATTTANGLVLIQLTSGGWKPVSNGQLIPYASGVLGDLLSAQTILTNTNTSTLGGAQFCVGYGTSASEMSDAGRMQLVATVPDASATSASRQSCLVTDTLQVQAGWNLLGNSRSPSIQAASLYSDAGWVTAVWKWDAKQKQWQIYAPSMDTVALQNLINDKGYAALAEIKPGEGYWVQATEPASVTLPTGTSPDLTNASLVSGWNLVASGTSQMASAMTSKLGNIRSLWAWDNAGSNWYFYAPSLDTGTALADYIKGKGYLDFTASSKTLDSGVGFWVNMP
jgi:streptogramin lyase